MPNRQFYTCKFKSSRLKEFGYNIENLTYEQAKINKEIIALADNQMLRSIRQITNRTVDYDLLEFWFKEKEKIKRHKNSNENVEVLKQIQKNIGNMMFIEEYITIVMEHPKHYEYLFKNGLMLNGKKYIRFSSSASQSRVCTVVFVEENVAIKLNEILDNGRNKKVKLCPSKFNAYKGLASSATKEVRTPRFCVIPDYYSTLKTKVNYVTETDYEQDDIIDVIEIDLEYNRFDGQGLISPTFAKQWAEDLQLDYVPAQWCIRQNYIKGMLCVFDFHKFCEEKNNGNYIINSAFKDKDGNPIKVDLRKCDIILSESQFKLINSFDSLEQYAENCKKNNLQWGVSLISPKKPNDILNMNYQFLQTLNLSDEDIIQVCDKFVNWINGVNIDNIYYTLLFLMGENINQDGILSYFKSNDNFWVKSLIVNHNVLNDKYIREKIYNLIRKRIERGCLGEIIVDGNFQTLVSDPYAFMQHACGHKEVTGLLKTNEYYCNYWNKKNITVVNSMRAPLTYRSEHVKLNLVNREEHKEWYKYCADSGVIVNVHGHETLNWAGSDYDMDIIATTSQNNIINSIFSDELPVYYEPPTPEKIELTEESLYKADLFAFGSIIGSITNKSTSAYALLPMFDKDSNEYNILMNRLKMCTKLQSAQIDKAKIGRDVKEIPKSWIIKHKINNNDSLEEQKNKQILNNCLLNKHPYFFIYLYSDTRKKYKKYYSLNDISCQQKFGIPLNELLNKKELNEKEQSFLNAYIKYLPVIDSDCVMNKLCKYIESIHFNIKDFLNKIENQDNFYELYMNLNIEKNLDTYQKVFIEYKNFKKYLRDLNNTKCFRTSLNNKQDDEEKITTQSIYYKFKNDMFSICSNAYELTNYLVEIFYKENKSINKDLLWNTFGKYILDNIKMKNKDPILFPIPSDDGNIEYLNKKYRLEEVII